MDCVRTARKRLFELISQPDSIAHSINTVEFEQCGRAVCILNAIEYCCHSLSAVDARTYHHAYLVEETCGKEATIDMSTTNYRQSLDTKLGVENIDSLG